MPLPTPFVRTVPEKTALAAVSSEHSVITLTTTPGIPGHYLVTRIYRK